MKSKSLIMLFVSLGFGLVAAIGISQVMGRNRASSESQVKKCPVLVARKTIDHETLLNEECVAIEEWPVNIVPEDALKTLKELENMVVATRILKGLPLLKSNLMDANAVKRLPIPPGKKVLAIPMESDETLNGLLQPGDRVDIIGVFKEQSGNRQVSSSRTFLKNIQVFSVGDTYLRDLTRENTGAKGKTNVGFLVSERESEVLVLAQNVATLKVVLRSDSDDEESQIVEPFVEQMNSLASQGGNPDGNNPPPAADPAQNQGGGLSSFLGSLMPKGDGSGEGEYFEQIAYNGDERVVTRFDSRGRRLDPDALAPRQSSQLPPAPAPAANPDDYEGSEQSNGGDYGLDEDQYPSR
jgi:pilus assembly protein CpaB